MIDMNTPSFTLVSQQLLDPHWMINLSTLCDSEVLLILDMRKSNKHCNRVSLLKFGEYEQR